MIDYKLYNDYYRDETSQAKINQMEYRARGNKKFTFMLSLTLFASYLSFNYIQDHSRPLILHISSLLEASVSDNTLPVSSQTTLNINNKTMTTEDVAKVVQLVLAQMQTETNQKEDQPSMISFN